MQVRIPQLFEEIAANKPHGLQIDRGHNCYAGDDNISLRNLCVLCASAVKETGSLQRRRERRDYAE